MRRLRSVVLFLFLVFPSLAFSYDRIISFRPNITEILFALGLGGKVVGVTTFCRYPPEAEKIDKIGGYFNRSLEKVIALKPDLVVLAPDATTPRVEAALKRSGVKLLVVEADSIGDVEAAIRAVASETGVAGRGEALVADMRKKMDALKLEVDGKIRGHPKKKALMVIQRRPLVVAGGGTFLDSLLDFAGLENIAGSSRLPYPRFSMETVLQRGPEVIVDLDTTEPGDHWTRYASLPAVRNGLVVRVPADLFVPGPRIPEALRTLIESTQ